MSADAMASTASTPYSELLSAVFTTALEGGINYWAEVHSYRWSHGEPDYKPDHSNFAATISDTETSSKPTELTINRAVIAKGYQIATNEWRDRYAWSSHPPPAAITSDTDWDFDAGDADAVVQLGLFGTLIYG